MEPAYLITWKPSTESEDFGWPVEELRRLYEQCAQNGYAEEPWRFKRRRGVLPGQPVFLIRQGRRGQALLGTGTVVKPTPENERRALIRFDRLVDPAGKDVLATAGELKAIPGGDKHWNTQSSGIVLSEEVAAELAKLAARRNPVADTKEPSNPDWTRDELILALDIYFREPSARGNENHPACQELSALLRKLPIHTEPRSSTFRNPNGVGMKLSNFLRYDPSYKGTGLPGGSSGEEEVWNSFADDRKKLEAAAAAIRSGAASLLHQGVSASDDDDGAEEGRILTRLHKLRERNPALARKKKAQILSKTGALKCEVCEFDFKDVYGTHGEGFAECHHGTPLSATDSVKKTVLGDLHIVCANCHRMLHKGKKWPSLAELKSLLSKAHAS